jgi:hypothetical protein
LGLLLPPYFRDYYYPPILGIIPPPLRFAKQFPPPLRSNYNLAAKTLYMQPLSLGAPLSASI